MMDYYSNFPGPSQASVINKFVEETQISKPNEPSWKVKMCAQMAIDDMGGEPGFGSCTGWAMFGEKDFSQRAMTYLQNYKRKISLKTLFKTIITFQQLLTISKENIWAPGGTGYQQCLVHFNELQRQIVQLPPIKNSL